MFSGVGFQTEPQNDLAPANAWHAGSSTCLVAVAAADFGCSCESALAKPIKQRQQKTFDVAGISQ